jgi:5-(carboxyamino)imidazole ribonucleotide synthase
MQAKKIGIIGAGQLGRMLALAGYPLGLRFVFLDKSANAPGGQVGDIIVGAFDDADKLAELAATVDILTFDVENVPVEALGDIPERTPLWPPVKALATGQDRLLEKTLFKQLDIPVTPFVAVETLDELNHAVEELGMPAMLKTRRLGYDGKGQRLIKKPADIEPAWQALGGVPLILEAFVDFDREVSIVAVRSLSGETAFYPISDNIHRDGILRYSIAPLEDALQTTAETYAERLLAHFEYGGVLSIEFFFREGELIANEIAPRVHNSGHWTIEGAATSQFENHVRAILDLPLGETSPIGYSAMINFIGEMPPLEDILKVPGAHYHNYGKAPRPGRKLGHCTLNCPDLASLKGRLRRLLPADLH